MAVGTTRMKTALTTDERKIQQQLDELRDRLSREVSPFGEHSDAAIRARHEACEWSIEAFAQTYAPHYATHQSAAFHADLDVLTLSRTKHLHIIAGPREHAKSVRIGRVGLLHQILFGWRRYPLVISQLLRLSQAHLEFLEVDLTGNSRIAADFEVEIVVRDLADGRMRVRVTPRATGVAHEIQVEAASYGTPVRGKIYLAQRPDFVFIDDFEDSKSVRNEPASKEKEEWVRREVFPAVDIKAPILWVGNMSADTSALYKGMLFALGGDRNALKAFLRAGTTPGAISLPPKPDRAVTGLSDGPRSGSGFAAPIGGDDDGDEAVTANITAYVYKAERPVFEDGQQTGVVYLWPERYTPRWYRQQRANYGPFVYAGEMQQEPEKEGDFFRREWFGTYKELPPLRLAYLWADPAFGKSGSACYKAVVVVGLGLDGRYYVVWAWVRQTDPSSAMIDAMYAAFARFDGIGLRHGGYENDFAQDDRLYHDFEAAAKRHGWRLPVAGDSNRRGSKDARIESLQPLAATGQILFPEEMEPDVETLFNQLLGYPGAYSDGPDALESAIARVRGGAVHDLEYTSLGAGRRHERSGSRHRRR